jgi:RNA polymerase sigma-70 factor (ECF subfamily)
VQETDESGHMSSPDADADLIRRAQNGERDAFEALIGAYYDVIYRIAYKWCGDKADAEDVTQNACIKLARAIDGYRFEAAFVTWLYPLVINTAKDWARAQKARATVPLDEDTGRAEAPAGEETVFAAQVMAFIRGLPDKEREALYLVFGEGLTHREAAAAMACKESTVSWYIFEARKKLLSFQQMECRYG